MYYHDNVLKMLLLLLISLPCKQGGLLELHSFQKTSEKSQLEVLLLKVLLLHTHFTNDFPDITSVTNGPIGGEMHVRHFET